MSGLLAALRQHSRLPWPQRVQAVMEILPPNSVPILIEALSDADADLRLLAVEVLAEMEPDETALPALVNALDDPDRLVRIAAVGPVVRFGGKAKSALTSLERWLADEQECFRLKLS